jgi:membrane-associated phospholipid phosphatase
MKGQIWRGKLRTAPRLTWSYLAWTVVPALLWLAAIYSRGAIIRPHCAEHPENCTAAQLLPMDRPAIGLEAPQADALSFTTQGLSGVLALGVPPLWHLGTLALGLATPAGAAVALGVDLAIFAQTAVWNGFLTESSHLVSQRPRPFVYTDPARARDFSNYTSFYSGHTSFSAASATYLFLTLAGRGAPAPVLAVAGAGAYALMSLTGTYRVLAGRHFPTDVLIGALAGCWVAFVVAFAHRRAASRDT